MEDIEFEKWWAGIKAEIALPVPERFEIQKMVLRRAFSAGYKAGTEYEKNAQEEHSTDG